MIFLTNHDDLSPNVQQPNNVKPAHEPNREESGVEHYDFYSSLNLDKGQHRTDW